MRNVFLIAILISIGACESTQKKVVIDKKLPYLGRHEYNKTTVNGEERIDTVFHRIPDFQFVNQDSALVNMASIEGKIYVADFFFTSCPTICPVMKKEMLRVYEHIKGREDAIILSHTIDPKHDTVALLRDFAERLGVESKNWQFLTGDQDDVFEIAQMSYMVSATEDESEPGGLVHSGAFILVDKERRIRGIYDGTKADKVNILIQDIDRLLKEYGG
jgi:protein SCO1